MYIAIATYVDLYSKQMHFALTTNKVDANGIADVAETTARHRHKDRNIKCKTKGAALGYGGR